MPLIKVIFCYTFPSFLAGSFSGGSSVRRNISLIMQIYSDVNKLRSQRISNLRWSKRKKSARIFCPETRPGVSFPPVVWARLGKAIFSYWLSLASCMETHDGGRSEFHVAAAGTPFAHTCLSVWHRFVAFINMRAVSVYPSRCIWYHFPPILSNTPRLPSTPLPPSLPVPAALTRSVATRAESPIKFH